MSDARMREALAAIMIEYRTYGAAGIDVMYQIAADALSLNKRQEASDLASDLRSMPERVSNMAASDILRLQTAADLIERGK